MKNKNRLFFLICYAAYAGIYIARLNLSMATPGLKEAGVLTTAQLGMLGSVFSVVFAAGRLLNGALSDKKPPYAMIAIGLLLAGLSNIAVGFFPPFIGILLLWSANAFAQSMLWSSILCVVSAVYDPHVASHMTSLMVTSVATGNILGILINLFLIDRFGIRWAFIIPGAYVIVMAALVLLILRRVPSIAADEAAPHSNIFQLLGKSEIRTVLIPAILHGTAKENIPLFMTVFFVDTYAIDLNQSAYFVLFIPLIGFIGRLLYPACYSLCKQNEHRVSEYAFMLCVVAAAVLCVPDVPSIVAMVCLSLLYAAISVINTSILSVYPIRYLRSRNVASVSGLMDFATYTGAGISSLIYGFVIEQVGHYRPMFLSWAVMSAISVAVMIFLNRRKAPEQP